MKIIKARVGEDSFPIYVGDNILENVHLYLNAFSKESVFIICDQIFHNTEYHPSEDFSILLNKYETIFLKGGLDSKGFKTYFEIIDWLAKNNVTRDSILIAIGGGVIGDICGFVASTYMRGIQLLMLPTTTTAMIDSSIGGKTGLNYLDQVNLIGSYYNAKAVFMDISFLQTLNKRDYISGISEAIKMAMISDMEMLFFLKNNSSEIMNKKSNFLKELIVWSVQTKLFHVADDAKEKSIRLLLNYGHTFGQAIETFYGISHDSLRHGEAVGLGMVAAAKLSKNIFPNLEGNEIEEMTTCLLKKYELPFKLNYISSKKVPAIEKLMLMIKNDKKRTSSGNRFVVCKGLGNGIIKYVSSYEILKNSLESIY